MMDRAGWKERQRSRERQSQAAAFFRGGRREGARDIDVVFDLLSNRRRRIVLDYLRDRDDEWVATEKLADRIASWEVELFDPASVSPESIEIDLAHGHLPKLAESGVVDYDEDAGRVSYCGDARVERFLDLSGREGPFP